MAFVPYTRPVNFRWVLFAQAHSGPELQTRLGLRFQDDPALPATYPYPGPAAADSLGTLDTAPFGREYLKINTGDTLPAAQPLLSSALYSLDILGEDWAGLLSEQASPADLTTEHGDTLTTEAAEPLAAAGGMSTAAAPLCTDLGRLRTSYGHAWFVAAQDWYLVRAEIPLSESAPGAGWLGEMALIYTQPADVPAYADLRVSLWQDSAAASAAACGAAQGNLQAAQSALLAVGGDIT